MAIENSDSIIRNPFIFCPIFFDKLRAWFESFLDAKKILDSLMIYEFVKGFGRLRHWW